MNAKELQRQYLSDQSLKIKKTREIVNYTPSQSYINHVKNQSETIARLLGEEQGNNYIEDAFKFVKK